MLQVNNEVKTYVDGLAPELKKLGKEAAASIEDKFDSLEQTVDDKKDALIDILAEKYAENLASVDSKIEALKAANSGLINKALGALQGVFDFIIKVKNTLTNLLAKIVEVVVAIITDPIGFFSNLIQGVGQGFKNFGANVMKHLQTGFIGWLTGAMQGVTITMPEDVFSLKGIFSLTMQVLGLGWNGIRAIGSKVIGEPIMKAIETGVEIVQVIRKDGIAGLWEHLKEQFQDLKATVMDAIMSMIQTQVIQAGIKWILGLLSPVGAFVKAAMAIVDVVKFFIERAAQIGELVNAFIDSVAAIASGKVGAVANAIENALGKAIPVLIGLLASILGIGGIANKVVGLIREIRKRITKAITKFWKKVKRGAGKLLNKFRRKGKKKKGKNEAPDWKDVREPFKADDGNTHTLFFKTKGGKTVLMVASTPQNFEDFVDGIKVKELDERTSEAKEKAKHLAKKIDSRKKDKTGGKTAIEKKKEQDIERMTEELSKYAAILFGIDKEGLPESKIKHLSKSMGGGKLATGMRATVLTRKGPKGSVPKETNTVYEKLFSRLKGNGSYYVRGHLLNEHIGGPGTLENLTPLSKDGNKNHLRAAEVPIKIAVQGGAIVDYILTVKYGQSVPEISDDQLEIAGFESEKDKATVRKIRASEKHVPRGLSLRSYYLKKKGGKYVRDKELVNKTSILNPIDLSLKSYKINSERKEKVSILHSSVEDLSNNTDFSVLGVRIIKTAIKDKKISNWNQIKNEVLKLQGFTSEKSSIIEIINNKEELLKNVKIK